MYRRRRVLAAVGSGLSALLFLWAVGALLGGNSSPSVSGMANGVPLTPAPSSSNPPAVGRIAQAGATSSSSASSSVSVTLSAPASPVGTTPPPGPPQPCPDSVLRLTATVAQPSYPVGQRPLFTLHVANTGPVPCTRDVSRQLRELLVLPVAGGAPLWGSDDCYTAGTHEIRTLQPGQEIAYSVAWAGRTSAPGCPAGRHTVAAGQYTVIARLGALASAPTPFALT